MGVAMRFGVVGGKPSSVLGPPLWTNASPDASFAAQTVSLNLAGYAAVLIEFKAISSKTTVLGLVGSTAILLAINNSSNNRNGTRTATISDTGIAFGNCTYNGAQTNTNCIPQRIFGIK